MQARRLEPLVLANGGQVVVDRRPCLGEALLGLPQRLFGPLLALLGGLLGQVRGSLGRLGLRAFQRLATLRLDRRNTSRALLVGRPGP